MAREEDSLAKQIEAEIKDDLRGSGDGVSFLDWFLTSLGHLILGPLQIFAWLFWAFVGKCHPSKAAHYRLLSLGIVALVAAAAAFIHWQHKVRDKPHVEMAMAWANPGDWNMLIASTKDDIRRKKEEERRAAEAPRGRNADQPIATSNLGYRNFRTIEGDELRGHIIDFTNEGDVVIYLKEGGAQEQIPLVRFTEASLYDILNVLGNE